MDVMDRRIAQRRRQVREDGAHRRLRWTLAIVGLAVTVGIGLWLLQSPWLALDRLSVSGVERAADVPARLTGAGVERGVPLIGIRPGAVAAAIERDPWVAHAEVRVVWPDTVEISILEHEPAIWLQGSDGWLLMSADGYVLDAASTPDEAWPVVVLRPPPASRTGPGDHLTDAAIEGAAEFLAALPRPAAISGERTHLWAEVEGHRVRLGRPIDMTAKAVALEALLTAGLQTGDQIDLLAPSRPAVISAVAGDEVEEAETEAGEGASTSDEE